MRYFLHSVTAEQVGEFAIACPAQLFALIGGKPHCLCYTSGIVSPCEIVYVGRVKSLADSLLEVHAVVVALCLRQRSAVDWLDWAQTGDNSRCALESVLCLEA
ncbi:hypothetical protein PvtlMGM2_2404 [Prevotella sp. MGM2]|nr:hypothetical protein PvtlMGM2_2404 [Prevotella sp. MGM2]